MKAYNRTHTLRVTNSLTSYITFPFPLPDCSNEESVRYGDTYNIHLLGVTAPITLEYRPLAVEANQTSRYTPLQLHSKTLTLAQTFVINGAVGRI
jgi:hypothetical protein